MSAVEVPGYTKCVIRCNICGIERYYHDETRSKKYREDHWRRFKHMMSLESTTAKPELPAQVVIVKT